MLHVVEFLLALVISWPSALILASAASHNVKHSRTAALAAAGVLLSIALFYDAASDARAVRGVFEDGGYCGSGRMAWDC